jgi:hypothetical protein
MARETTGPVRGGHVARHAPTIPFDLNAAPVHARGRTDAMAEIIVHAAFLKRTDMVPFDTKPLSSSGARFQDFRGGPRHYAMAHRAPLTLHVGGHNLADFAWRRPRLRDMLIAPQARTDPLPPASNYGDCLFEYVARDPTLAILRKLLFVQKRGKDIETNAIIDAIYALKDAYRTCYEQAIANSQRILRDRGVVEMRLADVAGMLSQQGFISDDKDIDTMLDSMSLADGGPSRFLDYPQVYLSCCQSEADRHVPLLVNRDCIEATVAELDEARATK